MDRLKEVLAFVNNKGGVAKTTTVQNTAAGLLRHNKNFRILCIDLDPQGNLSSLLGWGSERKLFADNYLTMADVMRDGFNGRLPVYKSRDGLFYCPASPLLANIEPDLHRQMNPKLVLNQLLGNPVVYMEQAKGIEGDYTEELLNVIESFDYVLIDCAPALSELTYNALGAATGVIIPMGLDALSVAGLPPMAKACQMVQQQLNHNMRMRGLLITKADERTNLAKSVTESVRNDYEGSVFNARIRECIKIKESQAMFQDIFEYAPTCTAALDYEEFVTELLNTEEE